jgi:protoporphyrinogen oxidase
MHYPPTLADFVAALGPVEIARCALSLGAARARALGSRNGHAGSADDDPSRVESYEDRLLGSVGRRAYDLFYAPYARKLYGMDPRAVHARAAKKRVTTANPWAVARAAAAKSVQSRAARNGHFFYPAGGFGSIPAALEREAGKCGVEVRTGAAVREIRVEGGRAAGVLLERDGGVESLEVETLVSSIRLDHLVGLVRPEAPPGVLAAARALRWRGIRLLQTTIARDRCLDGETYYFPEEEYLFGRISEPSQFSARLAGARGETTLNIEVICSPGDAVWSLDEEAFLARVLVDVERVGIFRRAEIRSHRSLRLPSVYPVYDRAYAGNLETALRWVEGLGNVYSTGRGGLFLHGNVDHSIFLGLRLAEHLARPGARSPGWREGIPDELFQVRD